MSREGPARRFYARAGELRPGDVLIQELFRDGVYYRDGDRFTVSMVQIGSRRAILQGYLEGSGHGRRMTFDVGTSFTVERPA